MKKRWSALFFCAVVLLTDKMLWAEAQYTGRALRDPFVDVAENKPANETVVIQQVADTMSVQGILYDGNNPLAIIDGKIYRVGSRLGGGQVTQIEKKGVTILQNGKQFTITQNRGKSNEPVQKKP